MSGWHNPTAQERLEILKKAKSIAIIGASDNPARASYFVTTYLLSSSNYQLYLVNPKLKEILGLPVYPSLAEVPVIPDIVDVFRKAEDLPGVLDETIAKESKVFWAQLGIFDQATADRAQAAGITAVMDKCIKIEHARFQGGLNLAGFNTGVIDSRRPNPNL